MAMSMMLMGTKMKDKKQKKKQMREKRKLKHMTPKQKFIHFIQSTPLFRDVSKKEIAERRRAKIAYMRYLEKNKISQKQVKDWLKDLPHHKQEIFSLSTTMLGATVPAFYMTMAGNFIPMAQMLQPIAGAVEPYFVPLMGIGVGTALAYDLWHLKSMKHVRMKLKKLGKWTDQEIDMIIGHLRHHKKKSPKMLHGVSRHHVKKLHKVM